MNEIGSDKPIVLVVEDDPLLRPMIVSDLNEAGLNVHEAESAEAALHLIEALPLVHVLFTDILLGGKMDGWTLAETFRDAFPKAGVIYATGYSPMQMRTVRGSLFFNKPYDLVEIVKAVQELTAKAILARARSLQV